MVFSVALGALECSEISNLRGCSAGRKWFGCDRSIFKGKNVLPALSDVYIVFQDEKVQRYSVKFYEYWGKNKQWLKYTRLL